MRISFTDEVEGGRVLDPIGRIKAASHWHATGAEMQAGNWHEKALEALKRFAEECEADAIIDVKYEIDAGTPSEVPGISLERVAVSGIAVKLSRAA